MNDLVIYIYESVSGSFIACRNVVSLYYEKDRYTPYSTARFTVLSKEAFDDTNQVQIAIDSKVIHQGTTDSMEAKRTDDGYYLISVTSKGLTAALCSNMPIPKINAKADLEKIMTTNVDLSLPYEADTTTVNYVYVLDKDTLWDTVVAYSIKAYSNYPYIRGSNTVRVTVPSDAKSFSFSDKLTETSFGVNHANMISQINMKDYDDTYNTYYLSNTYAIERSVIRRKVIELDNQWLAAPETALSSRVNYSLRGVRFKAAKYEGYSGEDLFDTFTVTRENEEESFIDAKYIHKIEISASKKGIFTKLYTYFDGYSGDIELTTS